MRTLRFFLIVLAVFSLLPVGKALAGADVTNEGGSFPIDEVVWNECTGENIQLSGSMLWTNHIVETKPGVLKWNFQNRYQGAAGIGLTSGMKYRAISGEHGYGTTIEGDFLPYHYAAGGFSTLRLVAQGNSPDLLVRYKITVTVTPDYTYQVYSIIDETTCK